MPFTVAGVEVPPSIIAGINRYVRLHEPQGGFLTACFENDFTRAVGRADDESLAAIAAITAYIYCETPSECHGSPEKVKAWLENR